MKLSKCRDRIALLAFGFLLLFSLMIYVPLNNSADSWFMQGWYHKLAGLSIPLGIAGMGTLLVINLLKYYELVRRAGSDASETAGKDKNVSAGD